MTYLVRRLQFGMALAGDEDKLPIQVYCVHKKYMHIYIYIQKHFFIPHGSSYMEVAACSSPKATCYQSVRKATQHG